MSQPTPLPQESAAPVNAGHAPVTAKKWKRAKTPAKPRKPRTIDPAIAAIIAENKAKLEALKAEGKIATAKVREQLASDKRLKRELHRVEKWSVKDRQRLLDELGKTTAPALPLAECMPA